MSCKGIRVFYIMKTFFVLLLLIVLLAVKGEARGLSIYDGRIKEVSARDTIPQQQKDLQETQDKAFKQTGQRVKAIKEVPRAKNLEKPKAIKMPSVKIKPVKIIKPKIKGIGLGK